MKKLIAVLMSLVVAFSLSSFAFANEVDDLNVESVKWNSEYGFAIQEYSDDNFTTTRTYFAKNNIVTRSEKANLHDAKNKDVYAETKAILSDLGMDDGLISDLSEIQLLQYSTAEQISVMVSYIKTDENGNNYYVSEEEALSNADTLESVFSETGINPMSVDGTEPYEDSYMKLTLTTTYVGNAKYHISMDSHWLKMPKTRSTDSLGICIENQSISWESRSGSVSFNRANNYQGYDRVETETLSSSAFQLTSEGSWRGIAAVFNLKNDWVFGDKFFNYKAHIEIDTLVSEPDAALNFNVVGVYHHTEKTLSIDDASIGIDSDGKLGVSIGISMKNKYSRREVCSSSPYEYRP